MHGKHRNTTQPLTHTLNHGLGTRARPEHVSTLLRSLTLYCKPGAGTLQEQLETVLPGSSFKSLKVECVGCKEELFDWTPVFIDLFSQLPVQLYPKEGAIHVHAAGSHCPCCVPPELIGLGRCIAPDHPSLAAVQATLSQLVRLTLPASIRPYTFPSLQHLTLETCDLTWGSLPDPSLFPALRVFSVGTMIVKLSDVQVPVMDAAVHTLQQLNSAPRSFECGELCLTGTDTLLASGAGSVFVSRALPLLQGVRCLSLLRVKVQPQQLQQLGGLKGITVLKLFKCIAAGGVLSEACDVFHGLDKIVIACKARALPRSKECLSLLERKDTLRLELACHTYCSDDRQAYMGFKFGMMAGAESGQSDTDEDGPGMGTHPRAALTYFHRELYDDSEFEQEEGMVGLDEDEWDEGGEEDDGSGGDSDEYGSEEH